MKVVATVAYVASIAGLLVFALSGSGSVEPVKRQEPRPVRQDCKRTLNFQSCLEVMPFPFPR